jgi:hypothetical protein
MLLFNQQIFDEIITGTVNTWYSGTQYQALLGSADQSLIWGFISNVSGTSPTLTVGWELSADGQNWVTLTSSPSAISEGTQILAPVDGTLPFMRLRFSLGGTSPSCRARFWVAGRSL